MCELFALSASAPVDVTLSLAELARHGGETGIHADGWGVAFLEGRDARLFREPLAAATSPWVRCLQSHAVESDTVVAHIRHATLGAITLANTQPFAREWRGRMHVFAHNGHLGAASGVNPVGGRFRAIGETDSEAAFCCLMDRIATRDGSAEFELFADFCRQARDRGPANFVLASDGLLLVHADRRAQRSGVIEPPGLWMLQRACQPASPVSGGGVTIEGRALTLVLMASVPLTSEAWQPLPRGTVLALQRGHVVRRMQV